MKLGSGPNFKKLLKRKVHVWQLSNTSVLTWCTHQNHKMTSLWKSGLNRSSKLRENDERKNTFVGRICVLSDRNKRLLARSLLLFEWEITSFSKTTLLQRESFPTMFYTINSSPVLVTKSVFKLIFVLSNYQTCTFPLSTNTAKHSKSMLTRTVLPAKTRHMYNLWMVSCLFLLSRKLLSNIFCLSSSMKLGPGAYCRQLFGVTI